MCSPKGFYRHPLPGYLQCFRIRYGDMDHSHVLLDKKFDFGLDKRREHANPVGNTCIGCLHLVVPMPNQWLTPYAPCVHTLASSSLAANRSFSTYSMAFTSWLVVRSTCIHHSHGHCQGVRHRLCCMLQRLQSRVHSSHR